MFRIEDTEKSVTLYRPSGLLIRPVNTSFERTRQWLREHLGDESAKLDPADVLCDLLPPEDLRELGVVIVTPDIEESLDEVPVGIGKAIRVREAAIRGNNLPSPSTTVTSFEAMKKLFDGEFHAGRLDGHYGPPAALFSPVLGLLHYHLTHLDDDLPEIRPDYRELERTHAFISDSLESFKNEEARFEAETIFAFIERLHPDVEWEPTQNGTFDVVYGSPTGLPCGILRLKNEVGLDGDASIQARVSYVKCVTEDKEEIKRLRKISNCPAVVIGLMGDLVEIGVAVYTDGPYSDFLYSSGRMRLGYHQNANVLRIARAFSAVKLALAGLRKHYEELKVNPPPKWSIQHPFPSPIPEPWWQGKMPRITFTDRLSRTGRQFTLLDPSVVTSVEVLVKFTAEYNADAHRILAKAGFAPALHACVPVCGGLKMVVMDRVQGENAWNAEQRDELPLTVYESVRSAIEVLHLAGFVFGDLRLPNIMCLPDGRAMLVDFDWVGKADEARYPATLNDTAASPQEFVQSRFADGFLSLAR
ncbi:hypothetical protein C8Q74DRAFT_1363676 [Fomes fomentarius]|nr:hypothetical protein C8Q74DRAFT_1363676 [Fomes fomentarius]